MNELATKVILDPPKADLVLIFSASWFVWAAIALVLLCIVGGIAAYASKKKEPEAK